MKQNQGKGLFVVRNVDNWKLLFWTLHPAMKRSGLNHLHKQGLWVPLVLGGRGKWIKVFFLFYRVGISEMQSYQSTNTFIQYTPAGVCTIWWIANIVCTGKDFALTILQPFPISFIALKGQEILLCIIQRYLDIMKGQGTGKICLLWQGFNILI